MDLRTGKKFGRERNKNLETTGVGPGLKKCKRANWLATQTGKKADDTREATEKPWGFA